jgi:hypothetical protein
MYEPAIQDTTARRQSRMFSRSEPLSAALVRHHVTPMARRGADGQEDRHVTLARLGERLLPPLPPVHRVLGMLTQGGRGRGGETVRYQSSGVVGGHSEFQGVS